MWKLTVLLILTGLIATSSNAELVSFYEFEGDYENTGTGTAVGLAVGDAQIVTDPTRGSVLKVDGDLDYVRINNDDIDHIDSVITVAAWVKSAGTNWSDAGIVTRGYNWRIYVSGSVNGTVQCMDTAPGNKGRGTVDINDGEWHHVAGTYDGTQYVIYTDGVQDGPAVAATGTIATSVSNKFVIGAFFKTQDLPDEKKKEYNGFIDDARVYDHVLSAGDIYSIVFPNTVSPVQPTNGATVSTNLSELIWLRPDPRHPGETFPILCDVYFGDPNMTLDKIESRLDGDSTTNFTPKPLDPDTIYGWRVDCYDPNNGEEILTEGPLWTFDTGNIAPLAWAGVDKVVRLSESTVSVPLDDATVEDDWLPTGSTLTQLWTVESRPAGATVVFVPDDGNPEQSAAVNPTVTIDATGTYVLRLTADDEDLTHYDQVAIQVPSCEIIKQNGFQLLGDIDGDCYVDLTDLAFLAVDWTGCNDPQDLACDKPFM